VGGAAVNGRGGFPRCIPVPFVFAFVVPVEIRFHKPKCRSGDHDDPAEWKLFPHIFSFVGTALAPARNKKQITIPS